MVHRLPIPGQDDGTWGAILNDFLGVSHAADGMLNSDVVGTAQVQDAAITITKLASSVQTSLSTANSSIQTVNGVSPSAGALTLTKSNLGLGNVDNTSDANK